MQHGRKRRKKCLNDLLIAGVLCNDASTEVEDGKIKEVGDPTEVALVVAFEKSGIEDRRIRNDWPRLYEIPFDPSRKIMATLHESPSGENFIFLKGAPEAVFSLIAGNKETTGDPHSVALTLANEGKRVLAFASKKVPKNLKSLDIVILSAVLLFLDCRQ